MYLCDTNIISELVRPAPNDGVLAWAETVMAIHLSVISVEEIYFGLAWKPHPKIHAWFETFLATRCTIVAVTTDIAKRCGTRRATGQRQDTVTG